MTYSEVKKRGFLARKEKYKLKDAWGVKVDSIFCPYEGRTLTLEEAKFVCRCSAVFHKTSFSRALKPDALCGMLG